MQQEYPSTPTESFETISEHSIYGGEIAKLRQQGRIKSVAIDHTKPVYTFWDIGRSKTDATCIWFMQYVNGEYNFIDYYQNTQKPVSHYAAQLQNKGYIYGKHYLPHDAGHNDHEMTTYEDRLKGCGIDRTTIVPRISALSVGIDMTRQKLPACNIDKDKCKPGIVALERYSYNYDEKKGMYTDPIHNWASHPSDAFRGFGQGFEPPQDKKRSKINYKRVNVA